MAERKCELLSQEEIDAILGAVSCESAPAIQTAERRRHHLQNVADHLSLELFHEFKHIIAEWDAPLAESLIPTHVPLSCIVHLSDRVIQSLLRGLDDQRTALILQSAEPAVYDRIMQNISQRHHKIIEQELSKLESQPDPILGGWAEDELLMPLRKAFLDGILSRRRES